MGMRKIWKKCGINFSVLEMKQIVNVLDPPNDYRQDLWKIKLSGCVA